MEARDSRGDIIATLLPTIIIFSDKGGVGKTPVAVNLGIRLGKFKKVGLIDADLESPNLPEIMGLSNKGMAVNNASNKFIPVRYNSDVRIFSMGCFKRDEPKKKKDDTTGRNKFEQAYALYGEDNREIIFQALHKTVWSKTEVFVVDLCAGTGDEFSAVIENFRNIVGVIIVTMPTTEKDMLRCLYLCSWMALPLIGVIENMNGAACQCGAVMTCPKCKERFFPFGESGIKQACEELGIRYFGSIPVSPKIATNFKAGKPLLPKRYDRPITEALEAIKELLGVGYNGSA